MTLHVHRPYPGVALVVTDAGTVLVGAPADAFKATKKYCTDHDIPFPRVMVAPPRLLVEATPQFNPEFFLYDFLFVYGAAFKPELAGERLKFVLNERNVADQKRSLRQTLVGPSRADMSGWTSPSGSPLVAPDTVNRLANVAEHMAIKKGDEARQVDDMVECITFDKDGSVELFEGALRLERTGRSGYLAKAGGQEAAIDLSFVPPVVPFATLPVPATAERPMRFGVKPLGTRSGFDLSGPTTGFVIWVNGQAVIYDGPVGTRYLLERQGISTEDIGGVILSHCHEDHMGAFVDLILAGQRPKVYTAEPIYRSALTKLAAYFERPEEEVKGFIDYTPIVPGEPLDLLGAQFDFFYTVHAIPTIGFRASMASPGGTKHQIQISGDTMHHEGLDDMKAKGVLSDDVHSQMRNLVPSTKDDGAVYLADVGEAIIHGHPKDWQGNPNRLLYYHCPDNDHTRGFGQELAIPGQPVPLIDATALHPSTPGRLLNALRFLDISDPQWFATILYQGQTRHADAGEVVASAGDAGSKVFTVIVAGTAQVKNGKGDILTHLRPGEFFGAIELVDDSGRHTATVTAETPLELFDINAKLFHDYVAQAGLEETVRRVWTQRPMVESAKIFKRLDLSVRNLIARLAEEHNFKAGEVIVKQGTRGDDFFVLIDGEVRVDADGKELTVISAADENNFFGEMEALSPGEQKRVASVTATTDVRALHLDGQQVRDLFDGDMGVRYSLLVASSERAEANANGNG